MKLFTVPNLMTLGNLLCGCFGIIFVFQGELISASYLIFLAGVLDFLDGFVARLLNQHSAIGKELDSLADMVTFGALPAFMIAWLISYTGYQSAMPAHDIQTVVSYTTWHPISYVAFILALFSALRLAKFNVDTRQSDSFIGVPTPANALVVASFPLIITFNPSYSFIIFNVTFLVIYSIVMSYLLVSEIPLFAMKFKNFSWADNKIKYIFIILSVILLVVLQFLGIPLVVFLYIVLSLFNNKSAPVPKGE
ncbi:CDP-diacylglycerol--serine O-phosphatidyltransferase [Emticicia sp. TH156]|uniref:CDP-diacylglycerol--serine O-phosphatidyltransferase n=1 Tax=Emticicia sp. TH156 TaxID=2067454 RepID=UPI000C77286A|nr:CDP-diacylglycerol--serine O-phosphatidyltransferase [Emticicia sp. TH156]PLK44081.1 CDP-diacylglycerol--serine O-phosphatidyltransferase [Emticicia sp. TH156]